MDDKLQLLVTRIEQSGLPENDKLDLYIKIREGLQSMVWPVMIKFMPKDRLETLSKDPSQITIESYGDLIKETIKDGQALKEIFGIMDTMLDAIEKTLTEQGVPETTPVQPDDAVMSKLKALLAKIDASALVDAEKDALLDVVADAMQSTILPTLVQCMPQDKVDALMNTKDEITADMYINLIEETMKDGKALQAITPKIEALLAEITTLLEKEGIG
jgi:hypothetical protein